MPRDTSPPITNPARLPILIKAINNPGNKQVNSQTISQGKSISFDLTGLNQAVFDGCNGTVQLVEAFFEACSLHECTIAYFKSLDVPVTHHPIDNFILGIVSWTQLTRVGCTHPRCGQMCHVALRDNLKRMIVVTVRQRLEIMLAAKFIMDLREATDVWAKAKEEVQAEREAAEQTLRGRYGLVGGE